MVTPCVFCTVDPDRQLAENALAVALTDAFPVTPGHVLIVPRRHVTSFFDLALGEYVAIFELLGPLQAHLQHEDSTIQGFNIGINVGEAAGQTVPHCHVHLIPRRIGDVANPRGGVRNVIPGMGDYTSTS
jgi:diadenosine tetraphosphate (Ap4A) HIT family hydrolase